MQPATNVKITQQDKYEWMQERIAIYVFDGELSEREANKRAIQDWYKTYSFIEV